MDLPAMRQMDGHDSVPSLFGLDFVLTLALHLRRASPCPPLYSTGEACDEVLLWICSPGHTSCHSASTLPNRLLLLRTYDTHVSPSWTPVAVVATRRLEPAGFVEGLLTQSEATGSTTMIQSSSDSRDSPGVTSVIPSAVR